MWIMKKLMLSLLIIISLFVVQDVNADTAKMLGTRQDFRDRGFTDEIASSIHYLKFIPILEIDEQEGTIMPLKYTFDFSKHKDGSVMAYVYEGPATNSVVFQNLFIRFDDGLTLASNSNDLFSNFSKLISITGIEFVDTFFVENMSRMFAECRSLKNLDLSKFNTINVINMSEMFLNCSSLTELNLSTFNTKKVTDMSGMFAFCDTVNSLSLSSFDTSNVTTMKEMFSFCSSLTSLDLSKFYTSNVVSMAEMFAYCSNLGSISFGNINTSRVTTMASMFYDCASLVELNLSNFNTDNVLIWLICLMGQKN